MAFIVIAVQGTIARPAERIRIKDNSNVGIGLTYPKKLLHIGGNARINGVFEVNDCLVYILVRTGTKGDMRNETIVLNTGNFAAALLVGSIGNVRMYSDGSVSALAGLFWGNPALAIKNLYLV